MIVAHGAETARVESAIPEELVHSAVIVIGSGIRDDVDLSSAGATHVRGVTASLHLKLLNGIGRRAQVLRVEGWISVCSPIEQKEVCVRTPTSKHNCGALSWPPIEWIRLTSLCAEPNMRREPLAPDR
jgi:hypothetical protein